METFPTQNRPSQTILGLGYSLLVDSKTTNGAYELMRFVAPPDAGPPPHTHTLEDESFLIQEGTFEMTVDGESFTAKPGDFVHLPRGQTHSFRNVGGTLGSFLCWVVPGNLERFFKAFQSDWAEEQELPPPPTDKEIEIMLSVSSDFGIDIQA